MGVLGGAPTGDFICEPDELWQLDLKGPFTVQGKKWYFLICIDDYSRCIVAAQQFNHCPSIEEILAGIQPAIDFRKPENILTDNNPFKEGWAELLANRESKPVSHTYITRKIKGKWNALSEIWQRNS